MKSYVLGVTAACFALMLSGMARASSVSFNSSSDTFTFNPNGSGGSQTPPPAYYRDYDAKIVETTGGFLHIPVVPTIVITPPGDPSDNTGNPSGNTGDPNGAGPNDPVITTNVDPTNPTVVPLPASSALAAVGLAGVVLISWRRSRSMA